MSVPYKNPISSVQVSTPQSVSRTSVFGTNFSVLNVGGYMEVYNLSDLTLTLTASTYPSLIQLSANTIPIRYMKGNGTFLSPDYLTLNSDNISSGRRRLGMMAYVHETDKVYQYVIPNYDTLWNNLSGLTGFSAVTYSDYTTVVNSRSSAGQSFIQSWTASTIEGVGGHTSIDSNWRIFQTGGGGTFSGGTVTGPTIFTNGLTANTISATTYYNLPPSTFSGGTVTGPTNFTNGLTANTISATTYYNLPKDIFVTGGTYSSGTAIFTNNTGGTFNVTGFSTSTGTSFTGGTVSGATNFTGGLTANTISATTYYNLPKDIFVTGGTYSSGSITITNNTGGTFNITGLYTGGTDVYVTGGTKSNGTVTFTNNTGGTFNVTGFSDTFVTGGTYSNGTATFTNNTGGTFNVTGLTTPFTGGTVSGATSFTGGLTANTISATTYQNLPATPFLPLSGGTVSGATNFTGGLTANTISATTYQNLPQDIFVTGGTYSSGSITITNNTGGTFTVTGFSTSTGTSFTGGTVSGATNFTDGLSANTISATTYNNLPKDIFVTGGTYTAGNAIFTNNSGGTFTVTGFAVGGGGGQTFYLNLSQSQNGNRLLSTTASTASEQSTGVTISDGVTSTISSFQSQPLNTTLLPGGIWSFYLHSYKQNTNASFNIFVELYKITSGGTQTLLFTTDPAPVTTNSPNPSMQLSDGYFSGTPLSVSDGVVAVVRATNTGNQSHIITLVTEGSQHYSYAVSTIPAQQGLTCDTLSGCSIIQTIQTDVSNKLDKSGGTITGNLIINSGLTATTISATTYFNLPTDIRVTGGTYSNGTATFTNNTGGTFNLTGLYTGGTDVFVTGATKSGVVATFTNNTGGTFTLTGLTDTFVTGGTYSNGTATFTNNTGGTFNVTGFKTNDVFVTGATYSNNTFTYTNNTGETFSVLFNTMTGLTATTISATTYQNLPTDIRVTGGTYSSGSLTFTNNTGGTFNITGLYTGGTDVYVTGGTYSGSTIIFTNNTGGTFNVTGITTSSSFTGGTVSGATNFTGGLTANTISATTITSPSVKTYGLIVATSLGYQNIF